jgi:uncharacterized protein (TIRG00374 family)
VKRFLNTALKLLVTCGLIIYLYLVHDINLNALGTVFAGLVPWLFAAAVGFFVISNILGALQWYLLLQAQDLDISFRQALIFYLVGVFFNNVLPGNLGGDALRIYDIKRLTGKSSGGVAATFMDRFIGLFSSCSLALAAYPLIIDAERAWVVSVLIPVWLGLVVLLAMGLSRRLGGFLESLIGRFLPARLSDLVHDLRNSIVVYRQRGGLLVGIWAISLAVQSSRILVYFCAGLAVGMHTGLLYFVCFQPVAAIIAALPISIGGLGVRENTLVELFRSLGVSTEVSTAMSLLGYIAGIIASLLGGIAFVIRRVERKTTES